MSKESPKGRKANANPLRAIRHADGFHKRVMENKIFEDEQPISVDDVCLGCYELLTECLCDEC